MKPIHIDIAFAAPLGFRAAKLVVTAGDVIKLMLQAHHVDLVMDSEAKQALFKVGNHVRRAFESAMTYREMNVSYKALKKMTAQAQKAIDALGEVPADILSCVKLPRHIPRMHLSTNKPHTQKEPSGWSRWRRPSVGRRATVSMRLRSMLGQRASKMHLPHQAHDDHETLSRTSHCKPAAFQRS